MKRFSLFPPSRFPALARAAVGGAVALGLVALGVFFFGGQDEAPEDFSASLLTSSDTTSFQASFDLFYLQNDDPTVGSGTWEIPASVGNAAATLDIGLVEKTDDVDNPIQVDTAEFLLAGVPTWLSYDSIAITNDEFTVDVVEGAESGDARDITIFVSPEEFSGDGTDPSATISGIGDSLTGFEVISVNFIIASAQGSADPVGSFEIFGTYVGRDAEFTRYQLDGNGNGVDGGAGTVTIQDSGIVEPVIASAVPHSATEIRLTFEEAVHTDTAQNEANYVVHSCDDAACANPTASATPLSAVFATGNNKTVVLTLDDADALIDADTDFDASSVAPLNFYAVQVNNVKESTGDIAIDASNNVSSSFSYHVPDISLVMSAKDTNGNAVTGNIEVYHTLVATVTADTAGSYELHYESGDNPIARCDSPQEHVFNVAQAGVSVVHEFSFESSGTYSFVACGHSDADRVEGVSTPVEVIIAPETIDIQISLAADDDYDGDYDFDTKDSLVFSVTADFSDPNKNSGLLSLRKGQGSCDIENPGDDIVLISDYLINRFDNTNEETIENTTAVIAIDATDIADPEVDAIPAEYSVVACVVSSSASDKSETPATFVIDWALPVVGAPADATLQTTEQTSITVTSDIAGSLIVKAFGADFDGTPSCATGTTIYSSIEDADSFTVPLIGGLVWDENANDYHANGLAQGEHTLLACVETAESAYEKQSSAEITVTVEPATAPTVSGELYSGGTEEMGSDIRLTVTSSIKKSTNGTPAYAQLLAFESTADATSCADLGSALTELGIAGDVDTTSGERIFEFNTTDLGAGSYVLRACVTANNATGENTTAWGLEVADYYAPVASLTPVTASIDTTQSVQFTVEETDDVPVSDGLVAKVYDISDNSTLVCASDLSGRTIIHQDDLTDQNNKQTTFTLAGDQVTDDGLATGSYTYLACITRTKGEVSITSAEDATATLTVDPAGAPGVSNVTATPSPAYPTDEVTVTATVTQGTSAWGAGEGSVTLYLDADSCSAADTVGATQLGEVFTLGSSSVSGEKATFAFDASTLGSFGSHDLIVCASANGSDSGADTVSVVYQDFEIPSVTAYFTTEDSNTNESGNPLIDTTEKATLTIDSDLPGTFKLYQTQQNSCDDEEQLSGHFYTSDSDGVITAAVEFIGEHALNGSLPKGTYKFLACVNRGSEHGNQTGSATATLEVTDAPTPVVTITSNHGEAVTKNSSVTVEVTSSQVNANGSATPVDIYSGNTCSVPEGTEPLASDDILSGSASLTFVATESMNIVACVTANGQPGESNPPTEITIKEDAVVIVDSDGDGQADATTITVETTDEEGSASNATLSVAEGSVASGETLELELIDLETNSVEVSDSNGLPENTINAVEIVSSDASLTTGLTLEIPAEEKKISETVQLQKWNVSDWENSSAGTLDEENDVYIIPDATQGEYVLLDLAEARADITNEAGGVLEVTEGNLSGLSATFLAGAVGADSQAAVMLPDANITLPDHSLNAFEIVAEDEDFDASVIIRVPIPAPNANENPIVTFYDEDDHDGDGNTDEWISNGIGNEKFIHVNGSAENEYTTTPDPLPSGGNWFIEFDTDHFTTIEVGAVAAPEPGETPVGIRIADGETFRLGYRQTLALRPAGGTGPYTLSVSPADSGSFTDLSGSAITQVAELEDFVFVPKHATYEGVDIDLDGDGITNEYIEGIPNEGRTGIVIKATATADASNTASITVDVLRRGNVFHDGDNATQSRDLSSVAMGWNSLDESADHTPSSSGADSGDYLDSLDFRLEFSPKTPLYLLNAQSFTFASGVSGGTATISAPAGFDASDVEFSEEGGVYTVESQLDRVEANEILITMTNGTSTTTLPVYILRIGDTGLAPGYTESSDLSDLAIGWTTIE